MPIFFLMVVLKIPVGLLLYLVWWAFRAETEPEEAPETGGGRAPLRPLPAPARSARKGPRRGGRTPDALPLPDCPPGGAHAASFTPARASAPRCRRRRSTAQPRLPPSRSETLARIAVPSRFSGR